MLDIDSVMFYGSVTIFGGSLKIKLHQVSAPSNTYSQDDSNAMMVSVISL